MALGKVLHKLNQKGISDSEKLFVENFCSFAYYTIPEFRRVLLQGLESSFGSMENMYISEWRNEFQVDRGDQDNQKQFS